MNDHPLKCINDCPLEKIIEGFFYYFVLLCFTF